MRNGFLEKVTSQLRPMGQQPGQKGEVRFGWESSRSGGWEAREPPAAAGAGSGSVLLQSRGDGGHGWKLDRGEEARSQRGWCHRWRGLRTWGRGTLSRGVTWPDLCFRKISSITWWGFQSRQDELNTLHLVSPLKSALKPEQNAWNNHLRILKGKQ